MQIMRAITKLNKINCFIKSLPGYDTLQKSRACRMSVKDF